MLLRIQRHQIIHTVIPTHTPRDDMVFFGVSYRYSRLPSVYQSVVYSAVIHKASILAYPTTELVDWGIDWVTIPSLDIHSIVCRPLHYQSNRSGGGRRNRTIIANDGTVFKTALPPGRRPPFDFI